MSFDPSDAATVWRQSNHFVVTPAWVIWEQKEYERRTGRRGGLISKRISKSLRENESFSTNYEKLKKLQNTAKWKGISPKEGTAQLFFLLPLILPLSVRQNIDANVKMSLLADRLELARSGGSLVLSPI